MPSEDAEGPVVYEGRLTEPAEAEMENAYLGRLRSGMASADMWYAGLNAAIESLETLPHRFSQAPEADELGDDLRQML